MKRSIVILTLCVLGTQGLFAAQVSTVEKELKVRHYDAEQTGQLQKIYDIPGDAHFKQNSMAMQRLIQAEADPNIRRECDSKPLLCAAAFHDDLELTKCCLGRGANLNPPIVACNEPPLYQATSVSVAQCLLDHNADLHQLCRSESVLHNTATKDKSYELLAFFCNAGVNPNQTARYGYTALHELFLMCHPNTAQKAAILLWAGAGTNSRNDTGETPLDILQQESPALVPQIQAIVAIIPTIKAEQIKPEQEELYRKMLGEHVPVVLTDLVINYVGKKTSLWNDSCWPQICGRITQTSSSKPSSASAPSQESAS